MLLGVETGGNAGGGGRVGWRDVWACHRHPGWGWRGLPPALGNGDDLPSTVVAIAGEACRVGDVRAGGAGAGEGQAGGGY